MLKTKEPTLPAMIRCIAIVVVAATAPEQCATHVMGFQPALSTRQRVVSSGIKHHHAFAKPPTATTTSLEMIKKSTGKKSEEPPVELDYGKIFGMLFNPVNPYAWFLYFFIGIFVYGSMSSS